MKILMINVVCGIRSTGRICSELADALTKQGHTVKIAYGREEVPEKSKKYAVRIGSNLDVRVHGVKARLLDQSGFGSKKATIKFIEWVKKFDPDVIHLHNIHGYYINIEVLFDYLRTCGKKIIWTLHDCWAFTGHTPYCDVVSCKRWVKGCHNCPLLKEYPKSLTDRSARNWNRKKMIFTSIPNLTIITPSKWLATLVKYSFLKQYPVKVINNGIDTTQFHPINDNSFRKQYRIEDKFILLGVSTSWDDMKGLSDYVKLAKMLDDSYRVVLVGLKEEQVKNIPNNMICIERTYNTKELAIIYSSSDLLLNLSYCENYPTVNLEAIACGTPVVTYNTGGSGESAAKYGGIIISKGDVKILANTIKSMKSNRICIKNFNMEELDSTQSTARYLRMYR